MAVLLLLFNSIILVSASLDHEFGVDEEKDKNDPSYKYKMRGIESIQLLKVLNLWIFLTRGQYNNIVTPGAIFITFLHG